MSEQRKTVTVLFCDLAGSTALGESVDPERLRTLLASYFELMKGIVEHHGGTVEKFIGDAVMAVFGVPTLHEDDALRAVRAAIEMRDALPQLGLEGRIGVMTGEVVTGTDERLATGDPVNVAARLEQAAPPGQILVGQPTLALVHDAVDVEPVEPLTLKGKAEPVPAHRLLHVREAPERRHDTLFLGRERELAVLGEAWERSCDERQCELATVVGEAGIGKSRLVAEALASMTATVVRGRCLPYGEGITYWPVVEVLKQLDVLPPEETAAAAIRTLLGRSSAPTSADEIAWAFRKTLEHVASTRPLVATFDDIQWAEDTLLDLIEHLALLSTGAPILLICMARPELLVRRPAWPVALRLESLDVRDVEELIGEQVSGDLRERIAHAAGGNPLYIAEMLAMADEAPGGVVVVPPSLRALLAARLDQLGAPERSVLERGAIEGEIFHRGAVQALATEDAQVTPQLAALVRKQLIRPDTPQLAGDDGFRFRHLLIRDAAYDALSKAARADLHQRFAAWLERHGAELVELDDILGYHLEQACRYRTELGLPADDGIAAAATQHLAAAGRRAVARSDGVAAVRLFDRALTCRPNGDIDLPLEGGLIDALFWVGRVSEALERADSLATRAAAADDRVAALCAGIVAQVIRSHTAPEGAIERLAALVEEALPVFETAKDDYALYHANQALGQVANQSGRMDAALAAYESARGHARGAGLPDRALGWCSTFLVEGSTPMPEMLAWFDDDEPRESRSANVRARRAEVLAMLGQFDDARTILAEVGAELADRGEWMLLALHHWSSAEVELLAGDAAAAARDAGEACRLLGELGDAGTLSSAAGTLAQVLYTLDRLDEADAWTKRAAELGADDDALTQMLWRQVRAKVLGRRGEHAEAERLAREATEIADATDFLCGQGDAYVDLGEVLLLAERRSEAAAAFEQALERYERKGHVVLTKRTKARLEEFDHARRR